MVGHAVLRQTAHVIAVEIVFLLGCHTIRSTRRTGSRDKRVTSIIALIIRAVKPRP